MAATGAPSAATPRLEPTGSYNYRRAMQCTDSQAPATALLQRQKTLFKKLSGASRSSFFLFLSCETLVVLCRPTLHHVHLYERDAPVPKVASNALIIVITAFV